MTLALQERTEQSVSLPKIESTPKKSRSNTLEIALVTAAVLFCAGRLVMTGNPQSLKAEAMSDLESGNYQRAQTLLESSLQKEGQSAATYVALAKAYDHLNEPTKALQSTTDALKLSAVDTNVWSERASVRLNLGQYQEALADSEEALSFDANNVQAKGVKALALNAMGR